MPYADNEGTRIRYEVVGTGPTLVLQHGFMCTLEDWDEFGYVAPLSAHYRLILIDARGHGQSDKPHNESSYRIETRVADVTSVLDAENIERTRFRGYSMGGHLGFGLAKYAPHRVERLVLGGARPYAADMGGFRTVLREAAPGGGDAIVAAFERLAGPGVPEATKARLRQSDIRALLAAADDRPTIEDVLPTMTMPCCLYAGDADPIHAQAKLASEQMPNAQFFSLPGLSHWGACKTSIEILPTALNFLGEIRP